MWWWWRFSGTEHFSWVRVHVIVYSPLIDQYYTLNSKSINSDENTSVMNKLVRKVKSLNPEFSSGDIRGTKFDYCSYLYEVIVINCTFFILEASYRYYKTKCEEESAKRRGLEDTLKKSKRKRERLLRVNIICSPSPLTISYLRVTIFLRVLTFDISADWSKNAKFVH